MNLRLGAAPGHVRDMVLRQAATMTIIGGLVGIAGALGVAKGAQSILYQMSGEDPLVLPPD